MKLEFSIKQHKASNFKGFLYLLTPLILMSIGIYLSVVSAAWSFYFVLGQILLGIFFFQCFILLHETGHFSYFNNRILNKIFGHLFAFISFIPLSSWIEIHNLHHKWTGYRDKDPTTEGTLNPAFGTFTKFLINASWLLWIPLFTIGYRLGNYWKPTKLKKHLSKQVLPAVYRNMAAQLLLYAILLFFFGRWIFQHLAVGYLFSLIISDLFILSQHSHIEIPIAGEKDVKPIRYTEQIPYTRSLALLKYVGRFIYFNFNLHELHHAYPGLPAYYLDAIKDETPNKVNFFNYLFDAKKMSGMDFIFKTSQKKIGSKPTGKLKT